MGLTKTIPPAVEPVTLQEAKSHLRIDSDDEDDLIVALIKAARQAVEAYTVRQLCAATYTLSLDGFPGSYGVIYLPRTPVVELLSVAYASVEGVTATLSTDYYELVRNDTTAWLVLKPGATWPSVQDEKYGAVTVTFTAGYGGPEDVPQVAKRAILLLVGSMFESREYQTTDRLNENPTARALMDTIALPKVV